MLKEIEGYHRLYLYPNCRVKFDLSKLYDSYQLNLNFYFRVPKNDSFELEFYENYFHDWIKKTVSSFFLEQFIFDFNLMENGEYNFSAIKISEKNIWLEANELIYHLENVAWKDEESFLRLIHNLKKDNFIKALL
jgi:hypothetical protein